MMCKTEANGRGEFDCMKEGRKVTRCAASVYVEGDEDVGWKKKRETADGVLESRT